VLQTTISKEDEDVVIGDIADFIIAAMNPDPEERRKAFPIGKIQEHRGFKAACKAHHKNYKHAPYRPVRQLWANRKVVSFCDRQDDLILLLNGMKLAKPALCTRPSTVP